MPIIYTYPSAIPTAEDLILISDVSATNPTKATRKCTIGDVVSLVSALVPGTGTVTSVGLSGGTTGLTIADTGENPIITAGTFTVGGTLIVGNGGTGGVTHTTGYFLKGAGVSPITSQQYINLDTEVTDELKAINGGTGYASYAVGDILYADTTTTLTKLVVGSNTNVLTLAGGVPTWAVPSTTGLVTTFNVTAADLPGLTPTVATSGAITLGGNLSVGGGGTGAVSLTSGYFLKGNGTSAVAVAQYVNLTADVTDTLPVENGGTERNTLTQHTVLVGNGTAAVQMIGPLTNGQLLIGDATNAPVAATLTAGANVTITNAAGAITIAAASSAAPAKVNWDNQMGLRGGTSGTFTPNTSNLAHYWTLGDYAYLEFYMEWTGAHGCIGTMIITDLPLNAAVFNPILEQGSCLITRNDYLGTSAVLPAPRTGIVGATGLKEVLLRTTTDATFNVLTDSPWANVNGEGGPYKLAGTIQWLISQD